MKRGFFKILVFTTLLVLSACTSKRYEWIKINPNKIALAKTASPYREGAVREINIIVNAKEKVNNIKYIEDSDSYFSETTPAYSESGNVPAVTKSKSVLIRKRNKSYTAPKSALPLKSKSSAVVNSIAKTSPKPLVGKKVTPVNNEEEDLENLNNSLRIPNKKKAKAPLNKEKIASNIPAKPVEEKTENVAWVENIQTEQQPQAENSGNVESKFLENLAKEDSISNADNEMSEEQNGEPSKKNNYLWVGLVLVIIGLIIGLIFGGMAYLISVVGIVFLLIGYFSKI